MNDSPLTDPVLLAECIKEKSCRLKTANGEVVYYSNRSPIKETPNEDALGIIPVGDHSLVLVVADGMGGMPAGEHASRIIIEVLTDKLINKSDSQTVRDCILTGIDHADHLIKESKNGSGSTASIVEIANNQIRTYYAGDSLILLSSSHGTIKYLSTSHSPIGFALECGAINQFTAMNHHERNLISNYVGSQDMYIHIGPAINIDPEDTLVISSDALSDNLYEQEICEFIRGGVLQKSVEEMIDACEQNMLQEKQDRLCHPDYFSLICFRRVNEDTDT